MSTPPDKIPSSPIDDLFESPQDVTRVVSPKESTIDWRDFLRENVPFLKNLLPTTEEAEASRREFEGRDLTSQPTISAREPSLYERIVPSEIRQYLQPRTRDPLRSTISTIGEIVGVTDPITAIEGPASAIPFASKLFSRMERAVESFPQGKATGSQWLSQLSKGVPEQEVKGIRNVLNKEPNAIYTREEIQDIASRTYEKPEVGEFVFKERQPGESYNVDFVREFPPTKYKQYKNSGGENYEEIVLTLNRTSGDAPLFESGHWDNIDNPIAHLRMSTRNMIPKEDITNRESVIARIRQEEFPEERPKVRQIEELQSDWAQKLRKFGPERPLSEMPEPNLDVPTVIAAGNPVKQIEYQGHVFELFMNPHNPTKPLYLRTPSGAVNSIVDLGTNANESIKTMIKASAEWTRVPNMPFSNTDQWVDLGLERAIKDAIDNDIDVLTWTPGDLQYKLYGSELIEWDKEIRASDEVIQELKNKYPKELHSDIDDLADTEPGHLAQAILTIPHPDVADIAFSIREAIKEGRTRQLREGFRVKAINQHRGEIPEIGNLEDLAQERGLSYSQDRFINSKEELADLLKNIVQDPSEAPARADKLWKRMQEESRGLTLPRREGMQSFYDRIIPKRIREIGKKMGVKLKPTEIEVEYPFEGIIKQQAIKITPELKKSALEKGFPLLSSIPLLKYRKEESDNPIDQLFD